MEASPFTQKSLRPSRLRAHNHYRHEKIKFASSYAFAPKAGDREKQKHPKQCELISPIKLQSTMGALFVVGLCVSSYQSSLMLL
jgi:hypothetical protein